MRFSVLAALALAGCATAQDPLASPDAESAAWDALLAPEGPAAQADVDAVTFADLHVDEIGATHLKVQQTLHGVPVWEGEAIAHVGADGRAAGFTDALLPRVNVDTTPEWTADEAIDLALNGIGNPALSDAPQADLWILRRDGADHLVWRVQLQRLDGTADDAMPVVFIDAHDGSVVWAYNNLQTATCSGTTNFYGTISFDCYQSGSTYYTEDTVDLIAAYTYNSGTRSVSYVSSTSTTFGTTTTTKNAVEALYGSQAVSDYYYVNHARDGIDGAGGPGVTTSHGYNFVTSDTSYSRNYVNAFWDSTGHKMVYGDGDGVSSGSLTTLDITGHEMTHGVTQYSANLTYSGESGGLNESMSDVMGAMVERSIEGETSNTWLMGEETWTPSTSGDALRYMNDPADDGYSYDYYSSSMGSADVHYTSGVGNLAFYMLSQGGTHPRGRSTTVVTGIGSDAAARIWYVALTSYMTSSTNYAGARTATLSAAAALYGSTSNEYTQVGNAWTAVGVAGASTTCSSTTYTGSLSKTGRSAYAPNSSGSSVTVASQTVALTGSGSNFDIYLQQLSGASWSTVASSTGSTSTESISYTGSAATYRVKVYSTSGSGTYSVAWCK